VIWAEKAKSDLDDIWHFTRRRWGEDRADLYLVGLNEAISDPEVRRLRARAIDFVKPGWFRMRVVRHFIYFRELNGNLLVERVLHDSMDETMHLP
jgi:toxin ParE1/3/4